MFVFPKLSNEKEFEDLIRDWFKIRTGNNNFQNFGKKGQKQFGIDSFGEDVANSEYIVVQCKNYTTKKTIEELKKEIEFELEKFDSIDINGNYNLSFYPQVKKYYFITSLDNNRKGQEYGKELNDVRVETGKCKFQIIYWDEIISELNNPECEGVLYQFFNKHLTQSKVNIPIPKYARKETLTVQYNEFSNDNCNTIKERIKNTLLDNDFIESKYDIAIGFVGKNEHLDEKVDIQIDFQKFYENETSLDLKWKDAIDCFNKLANILIDSDKYISYKIVIYQKKLQPSLSILIGFCLRKKLSGRNIQIIFKSMVLSNESKNLQMSDSGIDEGKIIHLPKSNTEEAIIIVNAALRNKLDKEGRQYRNIVGKLKPEYIFEFNSNEILNSSNGYYKANYLARRIHQISNSYSLKVLHLIIVAPDQFCTLLGSLLDMLNSEIKLYFLDGDRNKYIETGKITNITF